MSENDPDFHAGFYVTDSANYRAHCSERPEFPGDAHVLSEWEVLAAASRRTADINRLRQYEREIGDPVLWNMVVADRRLFLGQNAVREQDYATRFGHDELLSVTQTMLENLEDFFDRLQPDMIVGFICVTAAEYAANLIARSRGIPFLNLRPTRLRNYFYAGEDVQEPSAFLEALYREYGENGIPTETQAEAERIVDEVRSEHAMYEGVLPPPAKFDPYARKYTSTLRANALSRIRRVIAEEYYYRLGPGQYDPHHQDRFAARWFHRVRRPVRLRTINRELRDCYATTEQLADMEYAFYPLHKEPEVTMLVYGRPFLNQIEVVRNIARSLPVGMKLVVKEHPGAIGYRSKDYYWKLLAIPNVVLAAPWLTSREVLEHTRLVTVIGGSIALEAAIIGRPVLVLGRVPFAFLPDSMLKHAERPDDLAYEICDLMAGFRSDEEAIVRYVAAVVTSSVPIDFYSVLIGRSGVYRPDGGDTGQYNTQINRLAGYLTTSLQARREEPMHLSTISKT